MWVIMWTKHIPSVPILGWWCNHSASAAATGERGGYCLLFPVL